MARIHVPCLVARTNKAGVTSWYWQPSSTLARAGFRPEPLGKNQDKAIDAARARNREVERWKAGLPPADAATTASGRIAPRAIAGTLSALIERYERDVLGAARPDGRRPIAASTARTYRTSLRRLDAWAGKHSLAFITRKRVITLRDAMMAPEDKGGIGHHAAHQTLKMGRVLFAFAMDCELVGHNPFLNFRLGAPAPRDVIWSPPAREAMVAAAHAARMPSMALAIQLGYAIGQREGDLLKLTQRQYVALPEHKLQPEDYRTLAAAAPDGVPRAIRLRQNKTGAWIEVPVTGAVRRAMEANIAVARRRGSTAVLLDDTRLGLYHGAAGQTRFQRDFADIRAAAALAAEQDGDAALADELATLQFRDLRRTCVVYLGELGLEDHLIAAVTGHDIDETRKILKTYMPRTTGRAARAIAITTAREAREAEARQEQPA